MPPAKRLRTRAVELNVEGLFRLLGGTADERLRFWEILKGITTPAEFRLVNQQMKTLQGLVNQVEAGAKELQRTAASIARE
jgi:hypothetical protein